MNSNDPKPPNDIANAGPILDRRVDALVGDKLRAYYDTLLNDPVPDRILELLTQLDAKDRKSTAGSSE